MPATKTDRRGQEADQGDVLTISSLELMGGHRQLIIQHGREQYRLLLTNSNKLILVK
jgi:hemin uptake protein HemP